MTDIANKSFNNAESTSRFANKTLQDYEVISVIGNGSFGTCFKVRDKATGELFAWKGIDYDDLSESKKDSLVSEISVLSQLQHPNIVQYHHHLVNHEAKSIFIVMECCEGGDLAQLIARARVERKRFEEQYIWRVLFQVCKALQVCHNKIKRGTILHRDIKPANIFLDAVGNAKLGDFGLARMLRRYESFAESFVGTPCYMSPELVKGAKYDRKSDVWAVGCLIYEMCALRPPFQGYEFAQLSANISIGKFSSIPPVYSADLQEMITFMLEVENEQRPSVVIVTRHPVLIRNIMDMNSEFPKLIEHVADPENEISPKMDGNRWIDLSSTVLTEQNSIQEYNRQRRLSFSGVFTPDLRSELFYSAKRRIFSQKPTIQLSDPELYESIRREEKNVLPKPVLTTSSNKQNERSPCVFTQDIFDHALQERLHAIRAQECLLKQRELNLNMREQKLNEREIRLQDLERKLKDQSALLEAKLKSNMQTPAIQSTSTLERCRLPLPERPSIQTELILPPLIPPRKPIVNNDETYCTIEPNDTMPQQPTMAKLNLDNLPAANAFPALRRVTFKSPKKFIKYDIENMPPPKAAPSVRAITKVQNLAQSSSTSTKMQASVSSKASDDSSDSTTHRRKSILSIFGLNRNHKELSKASTTTTKSPPVTTKQSQFAPAPKAEAKNILSKLETAELSNIWTREHKRAAFDLLAAMNASKREGENMQHCTQVQRHKLRQSVRDRNTLQRNRLRRSLATAPQINAGLVRDRIIV